MNKFNKEEGYESPEIQQIEIVTQTVIAASGEKEGYSPTEW